MAMQQWRMHRPLSSPPDSESIKHQPCLRTTCTYFRTWESRIHPLGFQYSTQSYPINVLMPPNEWLPPPVWSLCWSKDFFLALIASYLKVQHRSPADDWKASPTTKVALGLQDFVFQRLWYKLKLVTRPESWLKTLDCPLHEQR